MQNLPADFSAGRQVLLYKSNYLDSLIAAWVAIRKSGKYIHIKDKTINLLNNPF